MATITGTSGNDTLNGTAADDTLSGLGGNDELVGSGGTDFYDGGSGTDTLNFRLTSAGLNVNFATGTISGGFNGTFTNMERVLAGNGNDSLTGGAGADNLSGRVGLDTLAGGAGNDWLWGGGSGEQNQFVFHETGTANADQIGDFVSGADKIVLDGSVMAALGATGNFAAGDARFTANASGTAQDADDRVIYESDTRQIWYDPDGNGAAARQLIATLQSGATLTATDIVVQGGGTSSGAINGTEGDDTLTGTPGNDTINGLGGNDSILGLAGDDSLSGGDGNDTLDGGLGADTVDGGLGDDTYVFNPGDGVGVVNDGGGIDTVVVTDNDGVLVWDLQPDLENLTLRGTSFFVVGEGNELDNVLRNEGTNASEGYLDGHEGNDTLIGGPYFLFTSNSGNYGHDFVDGAGDNGTLIAGARSAATVDFRSGTVVGGGIDGGGTVAFVNIRSAGGGQFNDTFIADDSGVSVRGDAGNDTFIGGAGNDHFQDDVPVVYDGADISGVSAGNDSLAGGAGDDILEINRGNDTVDGGAGNDLIAIDIGSWFTGSGYTFNDVIDGGAGIDTLRIIPLSAVDVNLGTGVMTGGGDAGSGSATLAGIENFTGGSGTIVGSAASNVLTGSGTLNGAGGNDTLTGGSGADQFVFDQAPGAANADHVTNFASGTDQIRLDATVMTALGAGGQFAPGDARFFAAAGATAGHDADDRVVYNTTSGQLFYDADGNGAGASQLIATLDGPAALAATDIFVDNGSAPPPPPPGNTINGTAGNDTLTGTDGNDTLNGLGGNDELVGSGGTDFYDGGTGTDTLNFRLTSVPMTVNFTTGTISGGFNGTFTNMERVLSGNASDSLTGSAGADNLSGRGGSDTLAGGAGNDWLWGGGGSSEENHFVFHETGTANADTIGDFLAGADEIDLDNAVMTALGADGAFAAGDGRFFAGAGASAGHDANDRVIYNTSTGQLYYDDDGSGAHAAQLIATLQGAPTLAASDISVI